VIRLAKSLVRLQADLSSLGFRWAAVGGLAVAARAEPRTTRDLDVALAVSGDWEAERIVLGLRPRGYREIPAGPVLEQVDTGRLATVRLLVPSEEKVKIIVDLLFASSGVEPEIVAAAEVMEVIPGVAIPVVRSGHLFALKVLAGRAKDLQDCQFLWRKMRPEDLWEAEETLKLITERGFHRGKDLKAEFARVLELAKGPDL
jgi:nucleotidyltransferase AbiEii toxin of type IV toxin-antitoxin system